MSRGLQLSSSLKNIVNHSSTFKSFLIYNFWLYARYLCLRDALGLKAYAAARPSVRATIGYLIYKLNMDHYHLFTLTEYMHYQNSSLIDDRILKKINSRSLWRCRGGAVVCKIPLLAHALGLKAEQCSR